MQLAVDAYKSNQYGLNECARVYNIPKTTLYRHVKCLNKIANNAVKKFGKPTTLPEQIEEELVSHILKLEELMFGLTINDIRKLAFDIAQRNQLAHVFNCEKELAGKKWYYRFMKRHPTLTLRQPESTSVARARGFNKENVYHFYDLLEKIVEVNKLDASRIFNVDESGFSTVQKKSQKIIGQKGKKQIGAIASGERGVNTTMVCCISASGQFIPPMIIFKRMRMAPELRIGAPAGSLVEVSESGYINSELFTKWLKHFIDTVKPTMDKKVLLLLDGHTTHSKNLDALLLAREHGVILLQLPGHTTHRLQPLDVTFFKPMETYYTQAMEKWLRTNPGMKVTMFQVSGLLAEAYERAACIQTAVNGFKATGIWPVNRFVFNDAHFSAADNLLHVTAEQSPVEQVKKKLFQVDYEQPSCSKVNLKCGESASKARILDVSIQEISPLPIPDSRQKASRSAQKAAELTSTPYKNELEEVKAKFTKKNDGKGKKIIKRQVADANLKKTESIKEQHRMAAWFCVMCKKEEKKDMIQCMECHIWVHAECANVSPLRKIYFCPKCLLYDMNQ